MQKRLERRIMNYSRKRHTRKGWRCVVSLLMALVVFCTTYALILPAITISRSLICGLEEHTHDAACYEEQSVLVCELPEDEEHSHEESCWQTEQVLTCLLEEHTHTEFCYDIGPADVNADVEAETDFQKSVAAAALTGEAGPDVVAVAKTQLGYQESRRNFVPEEDGTLSGYTRYGAWYGRPYADWDAMFVSFVLHYAGVEDLGRHHDSCAWTQELKTKGLFAPLTDTEPIPGDVIFLDSDLDGTIDRAGIVSAFDGVTLRVIEGDHEDAVGETAYAAHDVRILGYGLVTLPKEAEASEPEAETETGTPEDKESGELVDLPLADGKVLLCGIPKGFVAQAVPVSVEIEGETVLAAYDITIYASEADRDAGIVWQPDEGETVNVKFIDDAFENLDSVSVYHMETPEDEPELVEELTPEGDEISFEAEGFSVYVAATGNAGSPYPLFPHTTGSGSSTDTITLKKQIEYTGANSDDYSYRLHLMLDGSTLSEGSVTTVTPGTRRGIGILLDVTETMLSTWSGASNGSNKFDAVRALLQGSDGFLSKILDGNTDVYIIVVGGQTGTATYLQLSDLVASGSSLGDFSNINNSLHVSQGISYVTGLKAAEYYMGNNIDSLVYIVGNETDTYVNYANGNVERGTTGTQAQNKNYNDYLTFMANHPDLSMYMLGVAPVERGSSVAQQMGAYSVNRGTGGGYYEAGNTGALEQQLTNIAEQIVVPPDKTTNISVTDALSANVSMAASPNLTATLVLLNADGTTKSSTDVTSEVTVSGGTVSYAHAAEIEGPFRLEIAFDIRTASGVYEPAAGYPDTGDADTDYGTNATSSNQPGFFSNGTATAGYTLNGTASGDQNFPKPVVQAPEKATITVTKQWRNTPDSEQTPVTVELRRGLASGPVVVTMTLNGPDWAQSADIPMLTATGTSNEIFIVETSPSTGFTVSCSAASVVMAANGSYTVTVTNEKAVTTKTATINITKQWLGAFTNPSATVHICTYDGTVYTDISGTPLTFNGPAGDTQTLNFTWDDADTSKTLYVYEDFSTNYYPVTDGDGSADTRAIGGHQLSVRVLTVQDGQACSVTLQNMATVQMPQTGGLTPEIVTWSGILLALGGVLLTLLQRERERRAAPPS